MSSDIETGRSDSIEIKEPLLLKWRTIARNNKRLHEAARSHYKSLADSSLLLSVVLGSTGGMMNVLLGVIDTDFKTVINTGQVVLGVTGLVATGVVSACKQLGWESKHHMHEEYTSRYSEVVRMINAEETLMKLNNSSYAKKGDFIKAIQNELDRIEDHAPPIPGFLETKLGVKSAHTNGD